MNYRSIIDNVLDNILFNRVPREDEIIVIEKKLEDLNRMVIVANNGNEEASLRSTQVICSVIVEQLKEVGIYIV